MKDRLSQSRSSNFKVLLLGNLAAHQKRNSRRTKAIVGIRRSRGAEDSLISSLCSPTAHAKIIKFSDQGRCSLNAQWGTNQAPLSWEGEGIRCTEC